MVDLRVWGSLITFRSLLRESNDIGWMEEAVMRQFRHEKQEFIFPIGTLEKILRVFGYDH